MRGAKLFPMQGAPLIGFKPPRMAGNVIAARPPGLGSCPAHCNPIAINELVVFRDGQSEIIRHPSVGVGVVGRSLSLIHGEAADARRVDDVFRDLAVEGHGSPPPARYRCHHYLPPAPCPFQVGEVVDLDLRTFVLDQGIPL
jgi:hypothetical protein